jgi:hypothetical protein
MANDLEDDGGTDTDTGTGYEEYPADSVDILVVVDNSGSMDEEQGLLATNAFTIIGALVNPLPESQMPSLNSVRVAVVSSDLGLAWGGNPYDPDDFEEGEGWPVELPPNCTSPGDNGDFQVYSDSKLIDLEHGVIPCDETAVQCPDGWECGEIVEGIGTCQAPGGDGSDHECPGIDGDWAETGGDTGPNYDLAAQLACLSVLGTDGCGFEQQLQAGAVALHKEGQSEFVRDEALLLVLVCSDEEDCSIEDKALFATDEIQNLVENNVNIACGNHPEYLYTASYFKNTFAALKDDNPNGVLFAAITGVPVGDACQGRGDEIGGCLEHPDMALEVVQENEVNYFKPACERYDGEQEITRARPGRRYVELATELGENGYVFSICNADWTSAMQSIAGMIADELTD